MTGQAEGTDEGSAGSDRLVALDMLIDEQRGKAPTSFPAMAVERLSEPMVIGKHEWRLVLYWYPCMEYDEATGKYVDVERQVVGYEWRPAAGAWDWRRDVEWPRYDSDNGQTAGMPRTLRKLWDRCPWAHGRKTRRPQANG